MHCVAQIVREAHKSGGVEGVANTILRHAQILRTKDDISVTVIRIMTVEESKSVHRDAWGDGILPRSGTELSDNEKSPIQSHLTALADFTNV
jgi:hypothetical protein